MSLASRSIRKASTISHSTGEILRQRQPSSIVAKHFAVMFSGTISAGGTQQPPHFHRQQRRHFAAKKAKKDDKAALKKQPVAKKKQAVSKGPSEEAVNANKSYKMLVEALDAPTTKPPAASKEEMDRRHQVGRNYVIGMFERNNAFEHDLSCKIRLKHHAVKMLPKHSLIRKAAMEIDDEGPPKWRHMPVWTPPIPGFDATEIIEEEAKKEKE